MSLKTDMELDRNPVPPAVDGLAILISVGMIISGVALTVPEGLRIGTSMGFFAFVLVFGGLSVLASIGVRLILDRPRGR